DSKVHGLGRLDRNTALFRRYFDQRRFATLMYIGAEFPWSRCALYGGNHFAVDHKATDVFALGLLDEFLDKNIGVEAFERIDNTFSRLVGFRQHHPSPLGAFQ